MIKFNWEKDYSQFGHNEPICGETVEVRREKIPLPGMLFLLAFGTKRILTRQAISPLSRLPSTRF